MNDKQQMTVNSVEENFTKREKLIAKLGLILGVHTAGYASAEKCKQVAIKCGKEEGYDDEETMILENAIDQMLESETMK